MPKSTEGFNGQLPKDIREGQKPTDGNGDREKSALELIIGDRARREKKIAALVENLEDKVTIFLDHHQTFANFSKKYRYAERTRELQQANSHLEACQETLDRHKGAMRESGGKIKTFEEEYRQKK
jgi:hypothetical protein